MVSSKTGILYYPTFKGKTAVVVIGGKNSNKKTTRSDICKLYVSKDHREFNSRHLKVLMSLLSKLFLRFPGMEEEKDIEHKFNFTLEKLYFER